jgi:hypothetical protein
MIPRLLDKVPRVAGAARHISIQQLAGYWTATQRGPAHTLSRSVEVLLAVDKTVFLIDSTEAEDKILQDIKAHDDTSPSGQGAKSRGRGSSYFDTAISWLLDSHTLSRSVEVLLAVDKTVFLIDSTEAEDKILQDGTCFGSHC